MDIKGLLFEHLLEIEHLEGRQISLKEFAQRIGVNDKSFNNVYNLRRQPSQQMVMQLARYFDDPRFYDVMGMERPDPLLEFVIQNWGKTTHDTRKKIKDIIGQYDTRSRARRDSNDEDTEKDRKKK